MVEVLYICMVIILMNVCMYCMYVCMNVCIGGSYRRRLRDWQGAWSRPLLHCLRVRSQGLCIRYHSCMYVCMYVCMCVCMYMYVCMYVYMYVYVCMYVPLYR
jgi:hypothetical protein